MREYTAVITIKVIASVMAESEDDAAVRGFSIHRSDDASDPPSCYGALPELVHPQVIEWTAYRAVSQDHEGFKARTFKEAYREVIPDMEPGCEAERIVFPYGYPALPE